MVIRCNDDSRVFDCIRSIDEDVDIVIALSSDSELRLKLAKKEIRFCETPRGNLSLVSNMGIACAKFEKVILTDSDTIFEPGCIRELFKCLDEQPVVKVHITFQYYKKRITSQTVAAARDYVNSLPLIYTPGIGIRKDIINKIGGFLFNWPVKFAVDADLDYRIKKAKLPVKFIRNVGIQHSPETLTHDLKAAYRIGEGCATSYLSLKTYENYKSIRWNDLKGVKLNKLPNVLASKGLVVAIYQILWDSLYWLGYINEYVKSKFKSY